MDGRPLLDPIGENHDDQRQIDQRDIQAAIRATRVWNSGCLSCFFRLGFHEFRNFEQEQLDNRGGEGVVYKITYSPEGQQSIFAAKSHSGHRNITHRRMSRIKNRLDEIKRLQDENPAELLCILKLHAVYYISKIPWTICEFSEHKDLSEFIKHDPKTTDFYNTMFRTHGGAYRLSLYFTAQLINAIRNMHRLNIYIWDLKSSNILILADGCIKIMDHSSFIINESGNENEIVPQIPAYTRLFNWVTLQEKPIASLLYTDIKKTDWFSLGCILIKLFCKEGLVERYTTAVRTVTTSITENKYRQIFRDQLYSGEISPGESIAKDEPEATQCDLYRLTDFRSGLPGEAISLIKNMTIFNEPRFNEHDIHSALHSINAILSNNTLS